MSAADVLRFGDVTAVQEAGEGRYTADAHPQWTVGGRPNGGYLVAIATRAALTEAAHTGPAHPHPLATSTHFCASPQPGPLDLQAKVLRTGRSTGQVHVRTRQEGKLCLDTVVTVGLLDASSGSAHWDTGMPVRSAEAYADAVPFRPAAVVFPVAMANHLDLRMEPGSLGFAQLTPSGRGALRGWLALPAEETLDPVSLQLAVDAFPPATFDVQFTGWVPTLQLTAYVRALPAPGPVQILHRAHLIADGRADESCHIWDSRGRLVAHSTQLAAVRDL